MKYTEHYYYWKLQRVLLKIIDYNFKLKNMISHEILGGNGSYPTQRSYKNCQIDLEKIAWKSSISPLKLRFVFNSFLFATNHSNSYIS